MERLLQEGKEEGRGKSLHWSSSTKPGMSILYPSRPIKGAVKYKYLECDGEVSVGFINMVVVRLFLIFEALRLNPGCKYR